MIELTEGLSKYDKKFREVFELELVDFLDSLIFCGIFSFDIIKFDKYMQGRGYDIRKHGSLKEYISKNYGEKAVKLIEELINSI